MPCQHIEVNSDSVSSSTTTFICKYCGHVSIIDSSARIKYIDEKAVDPISQLPQKLNTSIEYARCDLWIRGLLAERQRGSSIAGSVVIADKLLLAFDERFIKS